MLTFTTYDKTVKNGDFWIVEPQPESGYPHIHAGYFTEFTDAEKDRLKEHWSQVVKAGDYNHGLDFSFAQDYKNGEAASRRNYLMKYLAKTFVKTIRVGRRKNWYLMRSRGMKAIACSAARGTCQRL